MKLILKRMDRDKDGKVTIDEYIASFTVTRSITNLLKEPLTPARHEIIASAYAALSKRACGKPTFGTLLKPLNPKIEPAVSTIPTSDRSSRRAWSASSTCANVSWTSGSPTNTYLALNDMR